MVRYLTIVLAMLLAAVGLHRLLTISESEIESRIELAIPFETEVTIKEAEINIASCIAAHFQLSNSGDFLDNRNMYRPGLYKGLGQAWQESASLSEYIESIEPQYLSNAASGAILHSKECLKELGVQTGFLWEAPIIASHSSSGGSVIFVLQDNEDTGWYFAGG